MKRLHSIGYFLISTGLALAAQNPPPNNAAQSRPAAAVTEEKQQAAPEANENFVIGLEDVLSINVWREPELSAPQVVVRPDGKITLPLVGDIQAEGFTTKQLQDSLTERLKEFVAAPTVTVIVVKIESKKVSIVGMVGRPGAYPLGAPMTVLELIARAGGLQEYASGKNIRIVRKKDGRTETFRFNYKEVINGKKLEQNITLVNGDVVLVP